MQSVDSDGDEESRVRPATTVFPLEEDDSCIAQARHLAADFLDRARTDQGVTVSARAVDLTRLVVSELVTNARKYAPGPLWMELGLAAGTVEVTVRDSVRLHPAARPGDPGRVGQHGLEIVMAVAESFQVRLESSGKSVTARIALADGTVADVPPGSR
ncbi:MULTISPECIES: ATP-binding protein [unclassified Streptomyces]|uniref:ATP-binding protein n=1 Tax=unclassified Streptomyces TaxID=2593676 RepID=UPI0038004D7C